MSSTKKQNKQTNKQNILEGGSGTCHQSIYVVLCRVCCSGMDLVLTPTHNAMITWENVCVPITKIVGQARPNSQHKSQASPSKKCCHVGMDMS